MQDRLERFSLIGDVAQGWWGLFDRGFIGFGCLPMIEVIVQQFYPASFIEKPSLIRING